MDNRRILLSLALLVLAAGCGVDSTNESIPRDKSVPVSTSADRRGADSSPDEGGQARAACANNLKQLVMACKIFAGEHEGRFPSELGELAPKYIDDMSRFSCPGSGRKVNSWENIAVDSDYSIVPNLTTDSPKDTVLLREKTNENHSPSGHTVCMVSCRTWFIVQE